MSDVEKGRSYGGGSGTTAVYKVEARSTYNQPAIYNDKFILDHTWRIVPAHIVPDEVKGYYRVPTRNWCPMADYLDLMNYQSAKALAELFLAVCQAHLIGGAGCIECRVVKVELTYSYSTKELGVGEIINRTDGPHVEFKPRETTPIALSAREEKA